MKDTAGSSDVSCDEGKEGWRSPGPPIRGGTMVWATSPIAHLETGGAFQVYNGLLQERKCFVTGPGGRPQPRKVLGGLL